MSRMWETISNCNICEVCTNMQEVTMMTPQRLISVSKYASQTDRLVLKDYYKIAFGKCTSLIRMAVILSALEDDWEWAESLS